MQIPVRVTAFINKALDSFNAGFTTKSVQKAACTNLNYAYTDLRDDIQNLILDKAERDPVSNQMIQKWDDCYYNIPMDLHQWRMKHADQVLALLPELSEITDLINEMYQLRDQIRAATVQAPVKSEALQEEERITKSIKEIMEAKKVQFETGLDLYKVFNNLPVSANVHWVTNQHGTSFLRAFYFLNGKLTPLQMIIAIMQAKAAQDKLNK